MYRRKTFFHSKRSDNIKNSSSSKELDVVLKDGIPKNFVTKEHHSFTFVFTFSVVVVVDLPTDCIFSFLFAPDTDVLVPVFSQSTDVVVVNFVVVLKFPVVQHATTIVRLVCLSDQLACFCFLFFFSSRVRVLAVKLQGNFKTSPSLPQAERLCSSSAKTLCALMIPLTTATDCYYGFCYASTFTSFKLFKIAFSIIITS